METTDVDPEIYRLTSEFFKASAAIYLNEESRTSAIDGLLASLLGLKFVDTSMRGVRSDGVIFTPCLQCVAILTCREMTDEFGMANADPYNQGSLSYRKYWCPDDRK